MSKMTDGLKPCPSCGYAPVHCGGTTGTKVDCYNCGMSGPRHENPSVSKAAWNYLPRHLQWTTETPTEPGWYFIRYKGKVTICYATYPKGSSHMTYLVIGSPDAWSSEYADEWAGPIPEPEEPKQ